MSIRSAESRAPMEPLLVRSCEAARLLRMGREQLRRLAATEAVPAHRPGIGRTCPYLFAPDELRAWVRCGCPVEPGSAERVRAAMKREARR